MPEWKPEILRRLTPLRLSPTREAEIADELAQHLEDRYQELLASAQSEDTAFRTAVQELEGEDLLARGLRCVETNSYRESIVPGQASKNFFEGTLQDVRYAVRMLRKSPGFTIVTVLTLALGIGANTAIFSVVNTVLVRALPYPHHDRIVRIQESHPNSPLSNLTYATFLDLARDTKTFENAAAYRPWVFNLTGEGQPERIVGAMVSGKFFAAFGTRPFLGRLLSDDDDRAGGNNRVTVLSYGLWTGRYGSDPHIAGRVVQVNSEPYTVIGVMPPGFEFPEKSAMWCPLVPAGETRGNRRAHLLVALADLRPGSTLAAARQEASAVAQTVNQNNPGVDDPDLQLQVYSLKKILVAPVRTALNILVFSVSLLLLIACANIANLLLSRSAARQREIAIRAAVGASPARLARQLLVESLLLGALGGSLGLAAATWSLRLLAAANAANIPRLSQVDLDWHVLLFTILITVAASILFGLAPVLGNLTLDLNASLKENRLSPSKSSVAAVKRFLLVPQFALATVLLTGAGLLASSFVHLLRADLGFNPHHLLTMEIFLSPSQYDERDPKTALLLHQMLERVRALPGVRSAGVVNALPITGGPSTDFVIVGQPAPLLGDEPSADIRVVDPAYFSTMGIPLLAGRTFTERDNTSTAPVLIVNQTLARKFWPNESPLGKRITMKDWGAPLTGEIVAIVGDVKARGLDEPGEPMLYWPYHQFPQIFNAIVVRSDQDLATLIPAIKSQIWSVDENQPVSEIQPMEEVLFDSLARRRIYMALLSLFAGAALSLAAVGIYGVMSYSVNQRIHELGLRLALGAERADVLRLVMTEGAKIAILGIAVGIAFALALTRLMTSLLYGVTATDPTTLFAVATVPLLVAMVACYIPARRAMHVDPIVALRYE
jgi:predicted permease